MKPLGLKRRGVGGKLAVALVVAMVVAVPVGIAGNRWGVLGEGRGGG